MTEQTIATPEVTEQESVLVLASLASGILTVSFQEGCAKEDDFMAAAAVANIARHFSVIVDGGIAITEGDGGVELLNLVFEGGSIGFDFYDMQGNFFPEVADATPTKPEEGPDAMIVPDPIQETEDLGPTHHLSGRITGPAVEGVDYTNINGSEYCPAHAFPIFLYVDLKGHGQFATEKGAVAMKETDGGRVLKFASPLAYLMHMCAEKKYEERMGLSGTAALREYRNLIKNKGLTDGATVAHIHLAQAMAWKFYTKLKAAELISKSVGYFHEQGLAQLDKWVPPYNDFLPQVLEEIRDMATHNLAVKDAGGTNYLPMPKFDWLRIANDTPLRDISNEIKFKVRAHKRKLARRQH